MNSMMKNKFSLQIAVMAKKARMIKKIESIKFKNKEII